MISGSGIKMKKLAKDKDDKSNVAKICRLDKDGKEVEGTEIEVCGECIDSLLPHHYMYFLNGVCYECGAKRKDKNGNELKPINSSKMNRDNLPEDSQAYSNDELGQDGFPRKTVLKKKLEEKGIFEGKAFKSLSYTEDAESESEKKEKVLVLVEWNDKESPYTLEDIETIIDHSGISIQEETTEKE
jgi:hypothetical protein